MFQDIFNDLDLNKKILNDFSVILFLFQKNIPLSIKLYMSVFGRAAPLPRPRFRQRAKFILTSALCVCVLSLYEIWETPEFGCEGKKKTQPPSLVGARWLIYCSQRGCRQPLFISHTPTRKDQRPPRVILVTHSSLTATRECWRPPPGCSRVVKSYSWNTLNSLKI